MYVRWKGETDEFVGEAYLFCDLSTCVWCR